MRHVVIIGGGVIGLSAAYALRQRGVPRITVLEASSGPNGASVVNAGWICPSKSDPVPSPGLVRQSVQWMLRSDSPLYIRPSLDVHFLRWLLAFWRHCTERDYQLGIDAMAVLNDSTLAGFDAYRAAGVRFEMGSDGIVCAYLGARHLEHDLKELERFRALAGKRPEPAWGRAVRELEPSLSERINGAFLLEHERHVRPDTLTTGLMEWLRERMVEIRTETPVTGLEANGTGPVTVQTPAERIVCDAIVIAAGAQSGRVAALLGTRLPIQAGKGYSLDYASPPTPVSRPISLHEARMAITPMGAWVRLAGTMELSGINTLVRQERVKALARGASIGLRDWPASTDGARIGSGLRPLTPDGLPVIGALPDNPRVAIATGHGMLGLTLAPATGDALAETLLTGRAPAVLEPFSPGRFC